MSRRSLWVILLVLLSLPIVFGVIGVGWVASLLPPAQGERITGPDGLVGIESNGSFAWIVPTESGVVLIDAGMDPEAAALERELAGRTVRGILLTHAHADHTAGLAAFPEVPVWLAKEDRPLLDGSAEETAPLALAYRKVAGTPPPPKAVNEVTDGQELTIDGARFRATSVPGVTPGSVAWLWHEVLFTGDAVWGGGGLALPPDALCEDAKDAKEQPKRLLALDFAVVADGQVGLTTTARPSLFRLLGEPQTPPTESLRNTTGGPRETRTGWLVRAPAPDARGERPEWLVVPGKDAWLLSTTPVPAHDGLVDHWVTVEGQVWPTGTARRLQVEAIAPATPAPAVPEPTTVRNLEPWVGRFVSVSGVLRDFGPLSPGSAWGEGTLLLPDGTPVPLHAPLAGQLPGPVTVLVRVERSATGLSLVVPAGT